MWFTLYAFGGRFTNMNIIEVIPISRGIGTDTLSYFTALELPLGALVDVPLRSKKIHGIVISSRKAEDMKGEIKSAGYALKKIDKIKSTEFFSNSYSAKSACSIPLPSKTHRSVK